MNEISLSVIIVSFNTSEMLKKCLNILKDKTGKMSTEIFVVDNDSKDDSVDMVKSEFPEVAVIANKRNLGFAAANNQAIKTAKGKYILLLNSDAFLVEDVLDKTIAYMDENGDIGILGVRLVGEDGLLQPSARQFPTTWHKFTVLSGISSRFPHSKILGGPDYPWWDHSTPRTVDWIPGAYFLVRREVFDQVGLLDERYFLYYEETDFCFQAARAGWKTVFYPYSEVIHIGGVSSRTTDKPISSSGTQLIHLRVTSEQKYLWKNYGFLKLLNSVVFEIFWFSSIFLKNLIIRSASSKNKRDNARAVIGNHLSVLAQREYRKAEA
ncbi:MAG: glycosyltransferase family 2 protein [Spirochaetales bacterium]|nr:glycosyltransferase family 2 protein [Spirochaetales bacterium]